MNIRNDGGTFYIFDESGGDHLFYSGIGVKTLTLTLDETNQGIFSGDLALGGGLPHLTSSTSRMMQGRTMI
jgi:hypothetical protein